MHLGAEMEDKADIVAASFDHIDDVNAARGPVQQHRAAMPGRRVERGVAVVFGGPARDVAVVNHLNLMGLRMMGPRERATFAGLAPAAEFGGVVRDRRPEIRAPRGLAVVAVGTRVGQDVHARVPDLDRQGVRVGMPGGARVAARAVVTPAPDLILPASPQQRHSCVSEPPRPPAGPVFDLALSASQGAEHHAARVRQRPRPPGQPAHQRVGRRQQGGPTASRRPVQQQRATFARITLARRAHVLIDQGRGAIRHRRQPGPGRRT